MPRLADAAGLTIDVVDSGAGLEFSRPEEAIQPHGPLANSLRGRMTGSAANVHADGQRASVASEATLDETTTSGA